jgi:hypothetical protein
LPSRRPEFISVPTKELAERFLAPLRGLVAILAVKDAQAKASLTNLVMSCATLFPSSTTILDVDAFYCANIDRFPESAMSARDAELLLPPPAHDLDVPSLARLLLSSRRLLVIDDLNSLHSLASDDVRSHQLSILMKFLSNNARINGTWVIATAYRTELQAKQAKTKRSLFSLGDTLIEVHLSDGFLKLKARLTTDWPSNELVI